MIASWNNWFWRAVMLVAMTAGLAPVARAAEGNEAFQLPQFRDGLAITLQDFAADAAAMNENVTPTHSSIEPLITVLMSAGPSDDITDSAFFHQLRLRKKKLEEQMKPLDEPPLFSFQFSYGQIADAGTYLPRYPLSFTSGSDWRPRSQGNGAGASRNQSYGGGGGGGGSEGSRRGGNNRNTTPFDPGLPGTPGNPGTPGETNSGGTGEDDDNDPDTTNTDPGDTTGETDPTTNPDPDTTPDDQPGDDAQDSESQQMSMLSMMMPEEIPTPDGTLSQWLNGSDETYDPQPEFFALTSNMELSVVPEPSTLSILALSVLVLRRRR